MLVKELQAWINNLNRSYKTGCDLYAQGNFDPSTLAYLQQGESVSSSKHLFDILKKIYLQYKNTVVVDNTTTAVCVQPPVDINPEINEITLNPELLKQLELEATNAYKNMMNIRAKLFALVSVEVDARENALELKLIRKEYALKVCALQVDVDASYSNFKHYKKHGKVIPTKILETEKPIPTNGIALMQAYENERKNLNKLKAKAATSARIALILKKEERLKILKHAIEEAKRK